MEQRDTYIAPIAPREVRYIKLGPSGAWERHCVAAGEMHFKYAEVPHEPCLAGDWEAVKVVLLEKQVCKPAAVGDALREIQAFYTLGSDCLWITFTADRLCWGFAEPEVTWLGGGAAGPRMRRMIGGWRHQSLAGRTLLKDDLSSSLTRIHGYQKTICGVKDTAYLLDRINDRERMAVVQARDARGAMTQAAATLIQGLDWLDFEVMADLIFSRSGWQRISRIGGSQKAVDLVLEHPTLEGRAFVQVKSKAGQAELEASIRSYRESDSYRWMYFLCHSPTFTPGTDYGDSVQVWTGDKLAEAATRTGLLDWLIQKAR